VFATVATVQRIKEFSNLLSGYVDAYDRLGEMQIIMVEI
jgi:hypothetical protein